MMDKIDDVIAQASERAVKEGFILKSIDGDFMAKDGKAYRDMGDHAIRDTFRGSEARLAALGWICRKNAWDYETGNVPFQTPLGSLWSVPEV
jgi:hypothetical protein